MHTNAGEIAKRLGGELQGDAARSIVGLGTLSQAGADQLAYYSKTTPLTPIENSRAGAVLVVRGLAGQLDPDKLGKSFIFVDDPQESFLGLLADMSPPAEREVLGVCPGATVAAGAEVGEGTNIHTGAIVGPGVRIGRRCDIHPGAVIGRDCRIGDDCTVFPNAVLYPGVQLWNRVRVHACAVIGADGFGYRQKDGRHEKIPHYGTVVVEDDVEIGAGTTIDRSFLGATRIGAGTKIDNQVVVAHNCELGKHNVLVSQVGFAGSVTTGDYVVCAGQAGIADHVHLGTGSVFGAKCGVHKDMPAGGRFMGSPADYDRDFFRQAMALKKLPELRQQVKDIERQLQYVLSRLEESPADRVA